MKRSTKLPERALSISSIFRSPTKKSAHVNCPSYPGRGASRMRIGSRRREKGSAGPISRTAVDTWATREEGRDPGITSGSVPGPPEALQGGAEPVVVVLDDHVAAVAQRARIENDRAADPVGTPALVNVPHQRDVGLVRFDEATHRRTAHGAA